MPTVHLKRNLERAIRRGHPWIYEDALAPSKAQAGEVVSVRDRRDRFLARGLREAGPLGVRVWTLDGSENLDQSLIAARLEAAIARRAHWEADAVSPEGSTDAYRLANGEGDALPGVVVDRYGDYAVVRLEGAIAQVPFALDALREVLAPRFAGVLLRRGRKQNLSVTVLSGTEPPALLTVHEHGMALVASLRRGQKTGLFLDHRASRRRVRALCAQLPQPRVLNLYGYTGGFSIAAGLGGAAHVTTVDVAAPAIELAERSWEANGLDPSAHRAEAADVPTFLEGDAERYDVIVADPPSFAPHRKAVDAALASYRKLHAACLARLRPGGFYLAASCSSHIDHAMFSGTLADGAADAGVALQILERWGGGDDHPRLAAFPEGDYLSVVLGRVLGRAA